MGRRIKYEMARNTMLTMSRMTMDSRLMWDDRCCCSVCVIHFVVSPEDKLPHDLVVNADIFVRPPFSPAVSTPSPASPIDVTLDAQ